MTISEDDYDKLDGKFETLKAENARLTEERSLMIGVLRMLFGYEPLPLYILPIALKCVGIDIGIEAGVALGPLLQEPMETKGPYEARMSKGMPTECCDYGVVSLSEGREVCRVWREQDARALAALLSKVPT